MRYDTLVLALGAQLRTAIPGALTFTGPREAARMGEVLAEIAAGAVRTVVFAVPAGVSWPLPLYELALLTADHAREHARDDVDVVIVTPEHEPLAAFGRTASRLVRELLAERGVRFLGASSARRFCRGGRLELRAGARAVAAERVIAAPTLAGRPIPGIPADARGFAPVDGRGQVVSLDRVYAAGDMTTGRIKQGGLATQQADAIAADIAARLGGAPRSRPPERLLRARLIGGSRPVELCATLDAFGRAREVGLDRTAASAGPATPETKVFGRYLRPYLTQRGRHAAAR